MKQVDFNALTHSVTYWLSYQDKIGRGFMIQESALKYPVADYLTGIGIPLVEIQLEFLHPELKNRRIDVVTTDNPTDIADYKILTAFEFKMVQVTTKDITEKTRVFNDLMRMYLVASKHFSESYFMIFGKHGDYIKYFRNITDKNPKNNRQDIPDEPEGFYTEWFGFRKNEIRTFNIENPTHGEYGDIYHNFLETYEARPGKPTLTLPKQMTTKCIAFSPLIRDAPSPYVGGIWKIENRN